MSETKPGDEDYVRVGLGYILLSNSYDEHPKVRAAFDRIVADRDAARSYADTRDGQLDDIEAGLEAVLRRDFAATEDLATIEDLPTVLHGYERGVLDVQEVVAEILTQALGLRPACPRCGRSREYEDMHPNTTTCLSQWHRGPERTASETA